PDYCGLILPKNLEDIWQIASIVAVSINDEPIGAFALTDTLKNDSLHAIQRLQQQNIDVVIMSGDQQS
ncbi:HAD family hydrolase, partial [Streptococcus pneumoniae]